MSLALPDTRGNASRDALQAFAVLGTFAFVGIVAAYLVTVSWISPIPRDTTGLAIGRDFLNFWMYGRAATTMPDPGRFYDPLVYMRELIAPLWPDYPSQNFSYPPTLMLLAAPFAPLPYLPALLIWTAFGLAVFIAVGRQHFADTRTLIALTISPAAMFCVMSGQSSLLTAATTITVFAWLDRRPVAAGILIGLLTLKPQLGLLFPVMLIAGGYWRVFSSAAITALALAALTALLFGPQVWIDYVKIGLPVQNYVLVDPSLVLGPYCPTIYVNLHAIGVSFALAMTVQLVFAALAAAAIVWVFGFRRDTPADVKMAVFLACSICATPYLLVHDTLALACATLMLIERDRLDGLGQRFAQLIYWLPLIQLGFGYLKWPGPALIVPAFVVYLVMHGIANRTVPGASQHAAAGR